MDKDIRWKQRFKNFKKAFALLQGALQIPHPDITQKAGIIQFFELSFELAWKTLKDYLEEEGFSDIKGPKSAIKQAYKAGLIDYGEVWQQVLDSRNLMSHTYNEKVADETEKAIRKRYVKLLDSFNATMEKNA